MHQGRIVQQPVGALFTVPLSRRIQGDKGLRVEERLDAIEKELAEIRIALLVPTEPSICQAEGIVERVTG